MNRPAPRDVRWFATDDEAAQFAAARPGSITEPAFYGDGFIVMVW